MHQDKRFRFMVTLLVCLAPLNAAAEHNSHIEDTPPIVVLELSGPLKTQDQALQAFSVHSSNTMDWEARYIKGLTRAKRGTTIGMIGLVGASVGLAVAVSGVSGQSMESVLTGGTMVLGGAGAAWLGGAVAQSGTSVSHRALADARLVPKTCGSCIFSWVLLAPPIAIFGGLPISYAVSAAERDYLKNTYDNYRNGGSRYQPTLKFTPIATRSGAGLGLSGTF
jgi:hypothetical protein